MQESSEYTVKRKDTYVSIAKQIGLKDPMKLKEYHNERADFNSQVGNELHPNITLLIPSSEEVRELNGEIPFKDEIKQEQREEEQKQQEEKEKEAAAEQQKQEEAARRERAFYADVDNAIAWMESFGDKLPVELQKQRLALTIDLRYIAYGDENSAEKLSELITKVTSWCAACGESPAQEADVV